MKIRLYFDEDSMDRRLVRSLRARGVDVVTALEAGMIERPDEAHLAYATEQERVLCTFNVGDFYRPHTDHTSQGGTHAGLILMQQQRYSVGERMRRLLKVIALRSPGEMQNRVEFLSARK